MLVNALDHVNIITADLDGTAKFYQSLLGLERRDGPSPLTPATAQWMHDHEGRAILHINTPAAPAAVKRETRAGPQTGAIHHVALKCTGHLEMVERLVTLGLEHHHNHVESINLRQIFLSDPNGVLIELNFFGEE